MDKEKVLLDIIRNEVNIKQIAFSIGMTEKGELSIIYDGKWFYNLNNKRPSKKVISAILERIFKNVIDDLKG